MIAWLLFQTALTLFPFIEAPPSLLTAFVVFLALGFVAILYISWAFEATPDGMKRTENLSHNEVLPTWSRRKFTTFIITVALIAASLLVFDVVRSRTKPASPPATVTP
jgi:hypothetical protein